MLVGQIGDLHIEEGPRFAETVRCIETAIDKGNEAGVQLWLILGDIFGTRVPYHASELERLTFWRLLRRLRADGVLVRGNHDADLALDSYTFLNAAECTTVDVVTAPRLIVWEAMNLSIVAFPYPSKRWVVGAEGASGIESLRVDLSQRLFQILRGLLLSCETDEVILCGHVNIAGSRIGGGEVLAGQEIELSKDQLRELFEIQPRLRYMGFGHIHRAQEIIPGAWYAGTPGSQGFDGQNEHGFLLIDTAEATDEVRCLVRFVPLPSTRHYTIAITWQQDETGRWVWGSRHDTPHEERPDFKGANVKLRPTIPESERKRADYTQIVDELRVMGATVILDPCIIPHARRRELSMRTPEQARPMTTREQLQKFWTHQEPAPSNDVLARALELYAE